MTLREAPAARRMAVRNASDDRGRRQNARPCPVRLDVRSKVWLERDGVFVMGDGGLRLLTEINAGGSLVAAARELGWSYRHAWQYLRRAEQVLGATVVVPRPGKGRQRGTILTADGRQLLALLKRARRRMDRVVAATGPTREEIATRGRTAARRQRLARSPDETRRRERPSRIAAT